MLYFQIGPTGVAFYSIDRDAVFDVEGNTQILELIEMPMIGIFTTVMIVLPFLIIIMTISKRIP